MKEISYFSKILACWFQSWTQFVSRHSSEDWISAKQSFFISSLTLRIIRVNQNARITYWWVRSLLSLERRYCSNLPPDGLQVRTYHAYRRETARVTATLTLLWSTHPIHKQHCISWGLSNTVKMCCAGCDSPYLPLLTGSCVYNVDKPLSVEASLQCYPSNFHILYRCGFREIIIRDRSNFFIHAVA
jgi:hypothetical protein